jgi:hypothetical protein
LLAPNLPNSWDSTWEAHWNAAQHRFERLFRFQFAPLGFFSRVMSGILTFTTPELFYKHGIQALTSSKEHTLLEFNPTKNELTMKVVGNKPPIRLLRLLIDVLHSLMTGWYSISFSELVPCLGCKGKHCYPIKDLEAILHKQNDQYVTCPEKNVQIAINSLAPDITFIDFEKYMIEYNQIKFERELGRGSFGIVSLGKYKGQVTAIKQLIIPPLQNAVQLFRDFRRELWMTRLVWL